MLAAEPGLAVDPVAATLHQFATDASVEVTPKVALASDARAVLRPGRQVYLTHLQGATIATRAEACAALATAGLRPTPHVAAREAHDSGTLERDVATLIKAGATGVLLIGGGGAKTGEFDSAEAALESGALERAGVTRIGLAGHPEGHPHVDDAALFAALERKLALTDAFATDVWIVTQFVFDAAPLLSWLGALRRRGITHRVRVGLSGPASPTTLLSYALRCGVGPSLKVLKSRPSLAAKMRRRWRPDALAHHVARAAAERPELAIEGLHIFPFGGLDAASEWLKDVAEPSHSMKHPA